jgi:hypothetical protein
MIAGTRKILQPWPNNPTVLKHLLVINLALFITDVPFGLSLSTPDEVLPSTNSWRTIFKGRAIWLVQI